MEYSEEPPFAGLRVIELATVLAGPSVGMFFAELGADVAKLEPPAGDVTRQWKHADEPDSELCAYFACVNWGKRSLPLDLRQPEGRKLLARMVETADVVVSNFRQGRAAALGAHPETLRAANPALVYGEITGYGQGSDRPGYDAVLQAESGFMHLNRAPGDPPMKMPVALIDLLAAHQLKEGLLAALYRRERTGRGATVSVSLQAAAAAALANQAALALYAGIAPEPKGSEHPNVYPYGAVFRTADGEDFMLAVGADRQFAALCKRLGKPEWAKPGAFGDNPARVRRRDELRPLLAEALNNFTLEELMTFCAEESIPAGAVHPFEATLNAPEVRRLFLGNGKGLRGNAFEADGFAAANDLSPPPTPGAGGRELLAEWAGLSPEEINALAAAGVVKVQAPPR